MLKTSYGKSKLFGRGNTEQIAWGTGCTACSAIITPTEIIVGNSGDSRAVLARKSTTPVGKFLGVEMSIDHKPELSTERARIEKAGGFVEDNRVKGVLNLSRSLGDLEYKADATLTVADQMITAVPEIRREKIGSDGASSHATVSGTASLLRKLLTMSGISFPTRRGTRSQHLSKTCSIRSSQQMLPPQVESVVTI